MHSTPNARFSTHVDELGHVGKSNWIDIVEFPCCFNGTFSVVLSYKFVNELGDGKADTSRSRRVLLVRHNPDKWNPIPSFMCLCERSNLFVSKGLHDGSGSDEIVPHLLFPCQENDIVFR